MSKVLYKFRSSNSTDIVNFEGSSIRYLDFKGQISIQKQLLGETEDFDLLVQDKTTGKIYHDDQEPIPKNSDLLVFRIPFNSFAYHQAHILNKQKESSSSKLAEENQEEGLEKMNDDNLGDLLGEDILKPKEAEFDPDEEQDMEKLRQVANFAKEIRGAGNKNNRTRKMGAGFPTSVTNQEQNKKVQRSNVGIPKTFIAQGSAQNESNLKEEVEDDELVDSNLMKHQPKRERNAWGNFGQDGGEFRTVKIQFTDEEVRARLKDDEIPSALKCHLSQKLLKDAVLLPCCYRVCSYDDLYAALAAENFDCPLCGQHVDLENVRPNNQLRELVSNLIQSKRKEFQQESLKDMNNLDTDPMSVDNNSTKPLDPVLQQSPTHSGQYPPRGPVSNPMMWHGAPRAGFMAPGPGGLWMGGPQGPMMNMGRPVPMGMNFMPNHYMNARFMTPNIRPPLNWMQQTQLGQHPSQEINPSGIEVVATKGIEKTEETQPDKVERKKTNDRGITKRENGQRKENREHGKTRGRQRSRSRSRHSTHSREKRSSSSRHSRSRHSRSISKRREKAELRVMRRSHSRSKSRADLKNERKRSPARHGEVSRRSVDRGRDRSRGRERDRSRERDRDRSRERDRDRSRERDRDRSRERGKRREYIQSDRKSYSRSRSPRFHRRRDASREKDPVESNVQKPKSERQYAERSSHDPKPLSKGITQSAKVKVETLAKSEKKAVADENSTDDRTKSKVSGDNEQMIKVEQNSLVKQEQQAITVSKKSEPKNLESSLKREVDKDKSKSESTGNPRSRDEKSSKEGLASASRHTKRSREGSSDRDRKKSRARSRSTSPTEVKLKSGRVFK